MLNLNDYKSPKNEASLFKGIPISERQNPVVRELMKTRLFSVKYRGKSKPNYQRDQSYIHKEFADTFAIYPYSGYPEYATFGEPPNGGNYNYEDYSEWQMYWKLKDAAIEEIAGAIVGD